VCDWELKQEPHSTTEYTPSPKKRELIHTIGGNVNAYSHYEEKYRVFPKN
jgi:hypothetical protein